VVIGASAGGVEALETLFRDLPADFPATVFTVLHVSPTASSILPQILGRKSRLEVLHPREGQRFEKGKIYIAPPNYHLVCQNGRVELNAGPKENRHRPAIDTLFRSAAREYGSRVIGVVLTGLLDDGAAGLWEIKRKGGLAVVQKPEDAAFPGMPMNAMRYVDVDHAVPLAEMGRLISSLIKVGKR
jgi:two-component system, chemotaxis family, protein-glutamate methylesterase/glutaminase